MVISWTNPAVKDLKEFKEITKMTDVEEYLTTLVKEVNSLTHFPHMGKIYTYLHGKIIRQLVHAEHRILYYEQEEIIYIVAVIHHKQDIEERIRYIQQHYEW